MPSKLQRSLDSLSPPAPHCSWQDSVFPEVVEWANETIALLEKELEVRPSFPASLSGFQSFPHLL
jgi:hypothetical protein